MNEMNALTPTNNNLVVFFKRNYLAVFYVSHRVWLFFKMKHREIKPDLQNYFLGPFYGQVWVPVVIITF